MDIGGVIVMTHEDAAAAAAAAQYPTRHTLSSESLFFDSHTSIYIHTFVSQASNS